MPGTAETVPKGENSLGAIHTFDVSHPHTGWFSRSKPQSNQVTPERMIPLGVPKLLPPSILNKKRWHRQKQKVKETPHHVSDKVH